MFSLKDRLIAVLSVIAVFAGTAGCPSFAETVVGKPQPSPLLQTSEIFSDEMADFSKVYQVGNSALAVHTTKADFDKCKYDTTLITAKGASKNRYIVYKSPNGALKSFAVWTYFSKEANISLYPFSLSVSADGETFEPIDVQTSFSERDSSVEATGGPGWYEMVYYSENIPDGYEYLKIEWSTAAVSANLKWEGVIGRVELGYVSGASELNEEMHGDEFCDILNNFEKVYSASDGVTLDKENAENFCYDSSRAGGNTGDEIVYKTDGEKRISDFAVWGYGNTGGLEFSASADNTDYTVLTPNNENYGTETVYWLKDACVGAKYFKIKFVGDEQVGKVCIYSTDKKYRTVSIDKTQNGASASVYNGGDGEAVFVLAFAQYGENNTLLDVDFDIKTADSGKIADLAVDGAVINEDTQTTDVFVFNGFENMQSADEVKFEYDGTLTAEKINVDNTLITADTVMSAEDKKVNIIVVKNNADYKNITKDDIIYIGNFDADEKISFNMPDSAQSAEYKGIISIGSAQPEKFSFLYIREKNRDEVMELINSCKTVNEIRALFDGTTENADYRTTLEGMGIMLDMYNAQKDGANKTDKDAFAKMILDGKKDKPYTEKGFVKYANMSLVVSGVNSAKTADEMADELKTANSYFEFDQKDTITSKAFKDAGEETLAELCEVLLTYVPFDDCESFENSVYDSITAAYFSVAEYGEISGLISQFENELDIDSDILKKYNGLDNYYKAEADKYMEGIVRFLSAEDVKEKFEKKVGEINPDTDSGGGKGGSGRGSSKSGPSNTGYTYVPSDTQPSQDTKTDEKVTFNDIDGVSWAKDAIETLAEKKIISGFDDGSFRPNENITRAEFAKLIVCAFGLYDEIAECGFDDTDASKWHYKYIASAYKNGIVSGISETSFGADSFISRQDMAVMVSRALNKANKPKDAVRKTEFDDFAEISDYAKDDVKTLADMGVISGIGTSFAPYENATRAQTAVIIFAVIK